LGHSAAGRIRSNEKFNDLIGNRTRDLPACTIMRQPTTLPRSPQEDGNRKIDLASLHGRTILPKVQVVGYQIEGSSQHGATACTALRFQVLLWFNISSKTVPLYSDKPV
jgi:hypothetical protein